MTDTERQVKQLIAAEKLPEDFAETVANVYRPLARELSRRAEKLHRPLIVGINGAQGTGKSTLAQFLSILLDGEFSLKTTVFSLDDIYLTKARRHKLAESVHPLLAVRGVPGTHDMALGQQVLNALLEAGPNDRTPIPAFDKAVDDRVPEAKWKRFAGKPAVIIVEGWCAGAVGEEAAALEQPINELERKADPDGRWRRFVNDSLKTEYREFFPRFDALIFIRVPRWELVYEWRLLQETKLKAKCEAAGLDTSAVMSPEQVAKFVQHYERVTRHTLKEMADRADYVLTMEEDHQISAISGLGSYYGANNG